MSKKYSEPDRNHLHNYMLDTNAYNHIISSDEKIGIIKKSVDLGFCYYSTAIQDMELQGKGANTFDKECKSIVNYDASQSIDQFNMIDRVLQVKLLPEVASFMLDHTRVDGTNRFLDPESLEGKVFKNISSMNKSNSSRPFRFSHDAMIAEAAIHYGCILVTDDNKMRNSVNELCPGAAITTEELVDIIKSVNKRKPKELSYIEDR